MLLVIVNTALVRRLDSSQDTLDVADGTRAVARASTVNAESTSKPDEGCGSEDELHLGCWYLVMSWLDIWLSIER